MFPLRGRGCAALARLRWARRALGQQQPAAGHPPLNHVCVSLKAVPGTGFPGCGNTTGGLKIASGHFSKSHLFFYAEARKWQIGCRIWLRSVHCCHDSWVIFIFSVTEQMAAVINLCLFWQRPGQNTLCFCRQCKKRSTKTSCVWVSILNIFLRFAFLHALKYAYVLHSVY